MAKYRTFIATGDFDEELYPIPPKLVVPSATECNHTPAPKSYHAKFEWMERASKTHRQIRCPRCGLLAIWLPKAQAREINKRERQEQKEIERSVKLAMAHEAMSKARRVIRAEKKREVANG